MCLVCVNMQNYQAPVNSCLRLGTPQLLTGNAPSLSKGKPEVLSCHIVTERQPRPYMLVILSRWCGHPKSSVNGGLMPKDAIE